MTIAVESQALTSDRGAFVRLLQTRVGVKNGPLPEIRRNSSSQTKHFIKGLLSLERPTSVSAAIAGLPKSGDAAATGPLTGSSTLSCTRSNELVA